MADTKEQRLIRWMEEVTALDRILQAACAKQAKIEDSLDTVRREVSSAEDARQAKRGELCQLFEEWRNA